MAAIDHSSAPHGAGLLTRIGARLREMNESFMEARARTAEFSYYNEKSDAELAKLGLRREEIARHVYRDMFI